MPRDAVSRTSHVGTWLRKRNGLQKWVKAGGGAIKAPTSETLYDVHILSLQTSGGTKNLGTLQDYCDGCWGSFMGLMGLFVCNFTVIILFASSCGKPWCTYQVLLGLIFVACSVL